MDQSLLVICAKRYNGHELWTALGTFSERGINFEVVSSETLIRDELTMQPNTIERTFNEISPLEVDTKFDGIVLVSGNMADTEAYWDDKHIARLLIAARLQRKVCAAICCSVPTLAPIIRGVEVSFFPLVRSRHALRRAGAILKSVALTIDKKGRIATAEHQMATQMWAEEICNLLQGLPQVYMLKDSKFTPRGQERRMHPEVRKMIDDANKRKEEEGEGEGEGTT